MDRKPFEKHQRDVPQAADDSYKQDQFEYPEWITTELIKRTIQVWGPRSIASLSNDDAVRVILAMGQLLDATGLTKLEELDEEIHGMGKSE